MTRVRVLFVDDEPQVLEGLQNLLHRQRHVWDMTFVTSGAAALAAAAETPFDVVVSDEMMPEMSGAALLETFRERCPATARLMLTGHADRAAAMRAVPVAHQFLNKPCDPVQLRAGIDRVVRFQQRLHHQRLREVVGGLGALPSPPRAYAALTELLADPDVAIGRIAALVETDPGMSAKILQLVNSAYFGIPHDTTSIADAVRYLGVDLLQGLVLSTHVFSLAAARPTPGVSLLRFQEQSFQVARVVHRLMGGGSEAFTAGLVQDVGSVVLSQAFGAEFERALEDARSGTVSIDVIERERFGMTHAETGGYLLGMWGLPMPIVEAVACHHEPGEAEQSVELTAAVHCADAWVGAWSQQGPAPALDVAFLERRGLVRRVERWKAIVDEKFNACQ